MARLFTVAGLVALLILGFLIQGCSFKVVATNPVDGDLNVEIDETLYVAFSKRVDSASVHSAFDLSSDEGPVAFTVQVVTPRVVSIDPMVHLRSDKSHLLRITTEVTSTAGVPLRNDFDVRFTTSPTDPISDSGPPPPPITGPFRAGVAVVNMTPPIGVPLAGYGGDDRRLNFPDLNPNNFHTFLKPSQGFKDSVMAKALVLDNGTERVCIVTLDLVATDEELLRLAHQKAAAQNFSVPLEKVLACSSHTHSGPGVMTKRLLWQVTAADLYVKEVADDVAAKIAQAMVKAEQQMVPVSVGVGKSIVTGVTENRRYDDSPDLNQWDVDPEMLVIRIDRINGMPLATVWNFAVHGTHFGPSNLGYSADIMGRASAVAEAQDAGVCLFINGAEGDIKPTGAYDATAQLLAAKILAARQAAQPFPTGVLQSTYQIVDMGAASINLGLRHLGSDIQSEWFVSALMSLGVDPNISFQLPRGWVEQVFRYQAIRVNNTVIVSMPGEPIHELGLRLKEHAQYHGGSAFDHVIPAGLANGHGGYFTTSTEYGYGGYEAMASMFGPQNGDLLLDACRGVMDRLRP